MLSRRYHTEARLCFAFFAHASFGVLLHKGRLQVVSEGFPILDSCRSLHNVCNFDSVTKLKDRNDG